MMLIFNLMPLIQTWVGIFSKRAFTIRSCIVVLFSLFHIYQSSKYTEHYSSQLTQIDKYRALSQIGNKHSDNNYTPDISLKPIAHEFILNITQYPFKGQWTRFLFSEFQFESSKGNSEYFITKEHIRKKQPVSNSNSNSSLKLSLLLKDGEYIDNFFMTNISFIFPANFSQNISSSIRSRNPVIISNIPCLISYYNGDFFENKGNRMINSTSMTMTMIFYPIESIITNDSSNNLYSHRNLWSQALITIVDEIKGIHIELASKMHSPGDKSIRVFNYCILITIIAAFQICSSVTFLLNINDNNQLGCNINLTALSIQVFYDSLLCSSHFFLSVSNDKYSINFGVCSMAYFILFSVFELHTLFSCWKARFYYLAFTDVVLFRRKLIQFYLIFYIALFSSMISLSFWFKHFCLSYLLFSSSWLIQIIHSVVTSTRPPMSYEYIFWFTIGKVIFPLYLKGCPYNIFELKPEYVKVYSITFLTIIEGCILMVQKCLGPYFLIPKYFRKNAFSYYKDYNELIDNTSECVICLESLKSKCEITKYTRTNEEAILNAKNIQQQHINIIGDCIHHLVLRLVNKYHTETLKKDYMVTPCYHEFHTLCLEKWIECKCECPYCRRRLPSLEG